MTIAPFGWNDFSPPGLSAENLEAMLQEAGAYTDTLRADVTSGSAIPTAYVKATGASSGQVPIANGSGGYAWGAGGGGGGTVTSVSAGDATITIGGTTSTPTVKVSANTFDSYGTATTQVAAEATARATADALLAPKASPALTGTPTAPTQIVSDNSTRVATTAYADRSATNAAASVTGSFAPLASPAFTGTPTAPTQSTGDNSTRLATTNYADRSATNAVSGLSIPVGSSVTPNMDGTGNAGSSTSFSRSDHVHPSDTSKASLASPTFTGTPIVPTATAGTNTTQAASTAFVTTAVAAETTRATTAEGLKAPLASPALTGTPTAPTATVGTNSTQIATTAFVLANSGGGGSGMPLGLTGATAATRYAGGTTTGAPTSGTFAVGDLVVDQTGKEWICTAAGTPGTWTQSGSNILNNFITGGALFVQSVQTVNASATLTATASVVNITGAYTLTLNSPGVAGRFVIFKNTSTTATASIAIPSGGTIDGGTTAISMTPLASCQLWCASGSGSGVWYVVAYSAPPSSTGAPGLS